MQRSFVENARGLRIFSFYFSRNFSFKHGLKGYLILENGFVFIGCGFGSKGLRIGEIVFTTSMVGYPEQITDSSYAGQLLVMTYPLIGNYGVPLNSNSQFNSVPLNFESNKIQVEGLIISEETKPSHWSSIMSLHEWFERENVPGISCVDTRFLVKLIREKGSMMGLLYVCDLDEKVNFTYLYELLLRSPSYDELSFLHKVSPSKPLIHKPKREEKASVLIIDCGVKYGIVRELLNRDLRVIRIPYNYSFDRAVSKFNFDGVVISNGPGNPSLLLDVQSNVRKAVEYNYPVLGVCLGNQILAIIMGGKVFKLKYGHRGSNKPVIDLRSGACFVTTQNHGFAVDQRSLSSSGFKVWFINADDKTVEGLYHSKFPIISVQFHPEASPGPVDSTWIFDLYLKMVVRKWRHQKLF